MSQASFSLSPYKNADVAYQRCTMNAIPTTHSVMKQSKVPCALVCTPYRSIKEGEPPVPVVHDYVIARCRRCRTYINPYVTFLENGNRWKCCMCNLTNDVPAMFDWNQAANQPADRWARPELNHAVVDFVAPTEYMVRAPQPPFYVFLLDVSYQAVHSGMLATAARTLLESLDRLPNGDGRTKISIIGVDSALHFFKLSEGKEEPELLVLGDLDDVFLPSPTDLLVPLSDARAGLDSLLSRIGEMFKDNHNTGSAMGSALQAAYQLIVRRPRFISLSLIEHCELTWFFIEPYRRQGVCPQQHLAFRRSWRTQGKRRHQPVQHTKSRFTFLKGGSAFTLIPALGIDAPSTRDRLLQEARHGLL